MMDQKKLNKDRWKIIDRLNKIFFVMMLFTFCWGFNKNLQSEPIHVFGDSHSAEFSYIPGCTVHWIGPITMHRVGRDKLNFLNITAFGVPNGRVAVFSFGEIDVRCHIGKQRDVYNRSLDEIIETLVNHYIYTILLNRTLYQNLICVLYSVTPPTDIAFNPAYPYYGTIQDRVMITKKLNSKLAEVGARFGILFLDVYNDYALPDGTLNPAIGDGGVHINPMCFQPIMDKLYRLLTK